MQLSPPFKEGKDFVRSIKSGVVKRRLFLFTSQIFPPAVLPFINLWNLQFYQGKAVS